MEFNNEHQSSAIRLLGKEKIIAQAIALLKEKQSDIVLEYSDYDIRVWANSVSVLVKFRSLFNIYTKDFPKDSFRMADITVNLISGQISPFDDWFYKDAYHSLTSQEKSILSFVKEKTGLPYAETRGYRYDIYEEETYYNVYIRLNMSFRNFHLDKITGEKQNENELNATPAQMPFIDTVETDPLVEIHS